MHMDTFLQAFNRLGLTQWDGIEQDIAWGHVWWDCRDLVLRGPSLSAKPHVSLVDSLSTEFD